MNPSHQLSESDSDGVVDGAIDARSHDFLFILETRPACVLPFHEIKPQPGPHGNFNGASGNFTVTHGSVAVAEIKQRPRDIYRQIQRVANGDFRSVHVAAKFRRHNGAARLPVRRCDADAAQKRMKRNFHFVVGIERLKSSRVFSVVDRVKPDFFRQRLLFQHRRVMGGIDSAKSR